MSLYKIKDLKDDTVEGLITKLVYEAIGMAHQGRGGNKTQATNEQRIVNELERRGVVNAEMLLTKLKK